MQNNIPPKSSKPMDTQLESAFNAIVLSFVIFFLFIAISSFLPKWRLWGMNHLVYYTLPFRIAGLLLLAASLIPATRLAIFNLFERAVSPLAAPTRNAWIYATIITVIGVVTFSVCHKSVHVIDEGTFLDTLIHQDPESGQSTLCSFNHIILDERIALGTQFLYLLFLKIGHLLFDGDMIRGVTTLSIILGGALLLSLLRYARMTNMQSSLSPLFILITVFSGTLIFFFGYLSKYTPFLVMSTIYILLCFRYIRKGCSMVPAVIFFFVVLFTHTFGTIFAPSLAFLFIVRNSKEKSLWTPQRLMRVLVFVTFIMIVAGLVVPIFRDRFLPLFPSAETTGILSFEHLFNLFNILLLIFPAVPLLFSLHTINRQLHKRVLVHIGESGDDLPNARLYHTDALPRKKSPDIRDVLNQIDQMTIEYLFAIFLFVPWVVFLVLHRPQFSMMKNWDLFILAALGILPLTIVGLKRFFFYIKMLSGGENVAGPALRHRLASIITPTAMVILVLTSAWVGIHLTPEKSIARYSNLLGFEPSAKAAQEYDRIGFQLSQEGKNLQAIASLEKALQRSPSARHHYNLALLYVSAEDTVSAIDHMKNAIDLQPEFKTSRDNLIVLLNSSARYGELLEVSKEGNRQEPENPAYLYFMGKAYLFEGDVQRGVRALLQCRDLNPPEEMMRDIDNLFLRLHPKEE